MSLALLMGAALVECCEDLPDVPAGVLYGRFLNWLSWPRNAVWERPDPPVQG